ncbi:hypothetical protein KGP36_07245 [Patescibacteria group bacterium]|nr:hypothetical protein [Patescibacteria group bacterium]
MKYGPPHILLIEGEEGEDKSYSVKHNSDCPIEVLDDDFMGHKREECVCDVEVELWHVGLDALSDQEGNEIDWRELAPGEYQIRFWSEYYPGEFGGSIGAEWDCGLELIK